MPGIRKWIQNHLSQLIAAIAVIAVMTALVFYLQPSDASKPASGPTAAALYTTDDGTTWFGAPRQLPPFPHNGKPAVQAFVFRFGDKEKVGYLMRCTPVALQRYATAGKGSAAATLGPQPVDCEVKRPGDRNWISMADPRAMQIMMPTPPPGTSGPAQLVEP